MKKWLVRLIETGWKVVSILGLPLALFFWGPVSGDGLVELIRLLRIVILIVASGLAVVSIFGESTLFVDRKIVGITGVRGDVFRKESSVGRAGDPHRFSLSYRAISGRRGTRSPHDRRQGL